jgi:hypothetical protein
MTNLNDLDVSVARIYGGKKAERKVKLRQIKEGSRLPGLFDPLPEDIKTEDIE